GTNPQWDSCRRYISATAPSACCGATVSMNAMILDLLGKAVVGDLDLLADVGVVACGAQRAELAPADGPVSRRPDRGHGCRQRRIDGFVRGIQEERHAVAFALRVR